MQGATVLIVTKILSVRFQSTLPMQGATVKRSINRSEKTFQSTLPMQGATTYTKEDNDKIRISIHAPYAGSDSSSKILLFGSIYFNPRSLCRERPPVLLQTFDIGEFQSTLPMQGATREQSSVL